MSQTQPVSTSAEHYGLVAINPHAGHHTCRPSTQERHVFLDGSRLHCERAKSHSVALVLLGRGQHAARQRRSDGNVCFLLRSDCEDDDDLFSSPPKAPPAAKPSGDEIKPQRRPRSKRAAAKPADHKNGQAAADGLVEHADRKPRKRFKAEASQGRDRCT